MRNTELRAEFSELLLELQGLVKIVMEHVGKPCGVKHQGPWEHREVVDGAQETIWTAEGTLLGIGFLREQTGISVVGISPAVGLDMHANKATASGDDEKKNDNPFCP